jgi:hypothetical protein
MAIADARKRKIGNELVDWLYLGIRSGARSSVAEYERLKASDLALATEHLKRAVNMPLRARARLTETSRLYELENGAGTFNAFISECLTLAGSVTIAQLNTELTTLENYANDLLAQKTAGATLDAIAADITAALRDEAKDWAFPLPANYADQW